MNPHDLTDASEAGRPEWEIMKLLVSKEQEKALSRLKECREEEGFDVNWKSSILNGDTLLLVALKSRAFDVADFLLDDPKLKHKLKPNEGDKQGNTPLHLACLEGSQRIIKLLLLDHQVDYNKHDDSQRQGHRIFYGRFFFLIIFRLLNHPPQNCCIFVSRFPENRFGPIVDCRMC